MGTYSLAHLSIANNELILELLVNNVLFKKLLQRLVQFAFDLQEPNSSTIRAKRKETKKCNGSVNWYELHGMGEVHHGCGCCEGILLVSELAELLQLHP